jgi:hypothetical protein
MEKFECTQRLTILIAEAEKFEYARRFTTLIAEAGVLAERINLARFEETIPDADHTTRLCETLDIVMEYSDRVGRDTKRSTKMYKLATSS